MPISPIPRQLGAPEEAPMPVGPQSPPSMEGLLPQAEQGGMSAAAPQAAVRPEDHAEALLQQFRDLSTAVQALARQYPAAAQDLAIANDALIQAMTKVISTVSAESSSAPPMLM